MIKRLIKLFEPEISEREERFPRHGGWTIISKYTRLALRGQREFVISFEEYDKIKDILKIYGRDLFLERRLRSDGKYKVNPLNGLEDLRIGIDPNKYEPLMWIKTRNKK